MNLRGPKSYEGLCMVNGTYCTTFRESVEKRGLLHFDNNFVDCMINVVKLLEQFEESMSEDFKNSKSVELRDVRHRVFNHINEELHSMGHDINEYKLVPENIQPSAIEKEAKDVHFERSRTISEEDLIFSNKAGTFFIDSSGGTAKIFLYRSLLETMRSKRFVALASASSSVGASILHGG
ncbi:hypothetical protein H5410_046625 [Solanum commersonii]|uniref:ATP-dependent DNA helicase n=1 Tax=Solanum commersonii TaxID=4109 RepID=A0A9J5XEY2_SOLCO|nr:hypothetical protein H5410_046625 [Solanum commersonii]